MLLDIRNASLLFYLYMIHISYGSILKDSTVCTDGDYPPGDHLATVDESLFSGMFQAAAARNFHAEYR